MIGPHGSWLLLDSVMSRPSAGMLLVHKSIGPGPEQRKGCIQGPSVTAVAVALFAADGAARKYVHRAHGRGQASGLIKSLSHAPCPSGSTCGALGGIALSACMNHLLLQGILSSTASCVPFRILGCGVAFVSRLGTTF